MSQTKKEKKFVEILSRINRRKREDKLRDLSEYHFYVNASKEKVSVLDHVLFQALMEQAEGLSLTFTKPHSYTPEHSEVTRLSKETVEALDKFASLRPTRLGPLTLIG